MLFNGTEKADTLTGGLDADTLYGYGGVDKLSGGAGDDVLAGMAGNDTLLGGVGEDYLLGGAGNDLIDGGSDADWASYEDAGAGVKVDLSVTAAQNTLGGGTDKLISVENLYGSAFNDTLAGNANTNFLAGGEGNDSLLGGAGEDHLQGGAGNDTINGGAGHDMVSYDDGVAGGVYIDLRQELQDVSLGAHGQDRLISVEAIWGSSHDDTLIGNNDANYLYGGAGNDNLMANGGGDVLEAADGDDHLLASGTGAGGDLLLGGAGNDTFDTEHAGATLDGGEGDDLFRLGEPTGRSVVIGGQGTDTLGFHAEAGPTAGVSIDLSAAGDQQIGVGQVLNLASIENLVGTTFHDRLSGDANANRLVGGAGVDTLNGGDGDDILQGGLGDDEIDGGAGFDTVDYADAIWGAVVDLTKPGVVAYGLDRLMSVEAVRGSAHSDSFTGDTNNNRLEGRDGGDVLQGGGGADTLEGGEGADVLGSSITVNSDGSLLFGGAGDDSFRNGLGSTALDGAGGNDSFDLVKVAGTTIIQGGEGVDTMYFADLGYPSSPGFDQGVAVDLTLSSLQQVGPGQYIELHGVENVCGTRFDDVLIGDQNANSLLASDGDDTISAGAGDDTLMGGSGRDSLDGGDGADFISGHGVFKGGNGADTFLLVRGDSLPANLGEVDTILDFQSADELVFVYANSSATYGEYVAADFSAAAAMAQQMLQPGYGQQYMVFQVGADVCVFFGMGQGESSPIISSVVNLSGVTLDAISYDNFV